jgi:tetratricopeptide (TPR) repeat protein
MAVTREAAQQATREGMPVVAARAMGELGYAFGFAKKWPEAVAILRESVEMAERAGSPATVASNRMKLGEALSTDRHIKEAVEVMEPAITWYKQNGSEDVLPLMLIKWGTVLNVTRLDESVKTFKEALDMAARHGNEMYQAMALQRLATFYSSRDLKEAAKYWERTLVLARKTHFTGVYFQAAASAQIFGQFDMAADLIAEGEREVAEQYGPGVDRDNHMKHARRLRAEVSYFQGHCAAGLRIASGLNQSDPNAAMLWRRLQACASGFNTSTLREHVAWFEARLARVPVEDLPTISRLASGAGEMALRLGDRRSAKRYAERGLEAAVEGRCSLFELDNLLVLRAAHRGLGDAATVDQLSKRVLQVAAQVGFDPPERFGGRLDLLRLWR